jgi:hypothetical protein
VRIGKSFRRGSPPGARERALKNSKLFWLVHRVVRISVLASAVLCSGILFGCAHALSVAPGYEFKEIPYAGSPFAWIDDETVLFTGVRRTSRSESVRAVTWGAPALHRWNTRTGDVQELTKTGSSADLCYDRGYLYVAFNRDGNRVIRQGQMGREKEFAIQKDEKPPFKGELNRHSCRWRERPRATQADHGVIEVLREDHGHIEAERPWDPFPARQYFLVRPSNERIPIEFHGAAGGPRFSEFRQGYVFKESISVWSKKLGLDLWLVFPDGRVEPVKIPPGVWRTGATYAMPVREAWFMSSLSTVRGTEGGYLVQNKNVQLIINGLIRNFAVSPDGCKVAMNIQPADGVVSRTAVINVCKGDI